MQHSDAGMSQQCLDCCFLRVATLQPWIPNTGHISHQPTHPTYSANAVIKSALINGMSQFFQSISTLLASQRLDGSHATSLVLERLYYADGRHNPNHPRHGSFEGLTTLASS